MDESTLTRRDVVGMLAGWGLALRAADLRAQDAAKVDPRGYKIRYENEQIRVLEFTAKPRLGVCGQGMHFHSDHVNILLTDATVRVTTPDGKTFVPPRGQGGRRLVRGWRCALGGEHRRRRDEGIHDRVQDAGDQGLGADGRRIAPRR